MTAQVFYRKWRPQTLAEVIGQEQVTQTLRNALHSGRVSHAYLFCGPRGTGKTSTGRILAKAVNCLTNDGRGEPCNTCSMCQAITEGRALDVIEIDAASNRGIDEIRDLRERVNYAPNQARSKIYIIDEVHMLTKEASNALLKTLEEPPPYVIFVLATTEVHKVLPTVLSRCQRFDFRRISQADIVSRLTHICSREGINIKPEALKLVARSATGSLRDAENILEQITTFYGTDVELHQVQTILGITGDRRTRQLVKDIISNDISAGIATITSINRDGLDLRQFNRELVEYLRGLLLVKTGSDEALDLTAEDLAEMKDLATAASLSQILKAVKLFAQLEFGLDNYSTLPLELALVDCLITPGEEKESIMAQANPELKQPSKTVVPPVAKPQPEGQPAIIEATTTPEPAATAYPEKQPAKIEATTTPEPAAKAHPKKPPAKTEPTTTREPEPETIVTTPLSQPGSEIEQLRLNWKRVIEQAPDDTRRTPAIAILRSAGVKPVTIENDTVVLSFKYDLHKEKMQEPENQKVAEKIISNFLGHPCHVRCIFEPEANHLVQAALRMGAQIINEENK